MTTLLAWVLGVYLLLIFGLSLYAGRRVGDEEDYLVAGRRLPLWLAWGTLLATWFGAATVLGAADAARREGLRGTLIDPFASGLALIVAGLFFAKPLWKMRLLTMPDFYQRKFGPRAEILSSVVLVPGYFGWVAAQYLALGGILRTFFEFDPGAAVLISAAVVLAYTLIGGMWSVTMTDTLQIGVVLVTLVILGVETFAHLGGGSVLGGVSRTLGETPDRLLTLWPEAGVAAAVAWVATLGSGVFGNIPGQDLMQRVFSARDSKTAVRACVVAGTIYLLFGLLPVGLGLASRILTPHVEGEEILGVLASQYLTPFLTVVFVVSLVSIIVSTCTSAVLSPAAILAHNVFGRLGSVRGRELLVDRLSVVLVSLASLAVAFSGRTILELLELSLSSVLVALFVPLVAGLFGRPRGERAAILAMSFGIAVWLAREAMVLVMPMPEEAARAMKYGEYIAGSYGSWPGAFAFLPSAVSGTVASLVGYLVGSWRAAPADDRGVGDPGDPGDRGHGADRAEF